MPPLFLPYPLLMEPFMAPRPWGGTRLRDLLGKLVPDEGGPYGESWELSDHHDGPSRVANGHAAGEPFGELLRRHPQELLGLDRAPARYPLMIKFIDAAENLSVQIHPDDAGAAPHGERGKSECWYVMEAPPGGEVIQGLRPGITAGILYEAALDGEVEGLLRRVPIAPGDLVAMPPGSVHALLAGTLICEIQQTSNLTWRLWDWNRQPPRELHIEHACKAIQDDAPPLPPPLRVEPREDGLWHSLVSNPYFKIDAVDWTPGASSELMVPNPHGMALSIVAGSGAIRLNVGREEEIKFGQTWFIPSGATRWSVSAGAEGLRILVSRSLEIGR